VEGRERILVQVRDRHPAIHRPRTEVGRALDALTQLPAPETLSSQSDHKAFEKRSRWSGRGPDQGLAVAEELLDHGFLLESRPSHAWQGGAYDYAE
jgi:hypothetical protein